MTSFTSGITPLNHSLGPTAVLRALCVYIYSSGDNVARARTVLLHIYNHAMNGRYHQARDLFLMSHMQDAISQTDIPTQIIYNRAVMQLGLAAFRNGYISRRSKHPLRHVPRLARSRTARTRCRKVHSISYSRD